MMIPSARIETRRKWLEINLVKLTLTLLTLSVLGTRNVPNLQLQLIQRQNIE